MTDDDKREMRRLIKHILDATEGDFKTVQHKHLLGTLHYVYNHAAEALRLLNEEKQNETS